MYNLINNNIDKILNAIDPDKDVKPYIQLVCWFNDVNIDVSNDIEFKREYRKYWQLNAARLSDSFCNSYFELLQKSKKAESINVKDVAQWLLKIPSHGDGRCSLQFSFASKFVHMLDRRLPIYDSLVEAFYFFPTGSISESTEEKFERLTKSYSFLLEEYERILQYGLLEYSINQFRLKFDPGQEYTDNKIIDTIIWRFVSFMRSGAIVNRRVTYG
ncbi:MAG TPA: hypothetical protein VMT73_07315 [Anaerolineales bacterium]|nr:hypothetical protein [Anaerolineales bacterium]